MSRQKNLDPYKLKISSRETDPKLTGQFLIYGTLQEGVIPKFNSKEERQVFEETLNACRSSAEITYDPEAEMQKFLSTNAKNPGSTEGYELKADIPIEVTLPPSFNDLNEVIDLKSFQKSIITCKEYLTAEYGKLNRFTLKPTKVDASIFKQIETACDSINEKKEYSRILYLFASILTTAKFHSDIHTHFKNRRDLITRKQSAINKLFSLGLVTNEYWSSRMFWATLNLELKVDLEETPQKTFFSIYRENFKWLKYAYEADINLKKPIINSLTILFYSFQKFRQNSESHFSKIDSKDKIHSSLNDYVRKLNVDDLDAGVVGSGHLSITDD